MVPKLHAKGSSFKGAAAYLLHDKGRAESSERVEWTEAHNIAVNDPEMAWRIMAATAMDQDRLKDLAGVKSTGRKSDTPVLHLTLAWHPEEKDRLSDQEMKRAAAGAIDALGAEKHQSLVIAHNDEEHPHLHILINRVHPDNGKMLSSSKEKLALSRWAEQYEKERGKVYCDERVKNNEAREHGEYRRDSRVLDRTTFEEVKSHLSTANDNIEATLAIRKKQKAIDAALAAKARALHEDHKAQWQALEKAARQRQENSLQEYRRSQMRMTSAVREACQSKKLEMDQRHAIERQAFKKREQTLSGRIHNSLDAKTGDKQAKNTGGGMRDLFGLITSRPQRWNALLIKQNTDTRSLKNDYKAQEKQVRHRLRQACQVRRARDALTYLDERKRLIEKQALERKRLRDQWKTRHKERLRDWHDMASKAALKDRLKSDFKAADQPQKDKAGTRDRIRQKLKTDRDKDKGRDGR